MAFIAWASATGTLTGTEPTGTQQSDVLLAIVYTTTAAATGPAGWTQISTTRQVLTSFGNLWYIVRGLSAPALTWGGGGSGQRVDLFTYRGYNTSGPIDASGSSLNASATSPSISPTGTADLLFCAYVDLSTNGATAPSGMTARSGVSAAQGSDLQLSSSGATGTKLWGSTVNPLGAWSVALIPSANPNAPQLLSLGVG